MPKRPRDPNQLGKLIVDIATGAVQNDISEQKKNPNRRGRPGGLKGGKLRAKRLTPAQRAEIARGAASARWKKKPLARPGRVLSPLHVGSQV
jgi:hypothetical protein